MAFSYLYKMEYVGSSEQISQSKNKVLPSCHAYLMRNVRHAAVFVFICQMQKYSVL